MPEPYKKIALPLGVVTLALLVGALFWRPAILTSRGAIQEIKQTEMTFETTKLRKYEGKMAVAREVVKEHPAAHQVVHLANNRESARTEGLLNMVELALGDNRKQYLFFPGDINYVDPATGEVVEADATFAPQPDGTFLVDKASYHARAPAYADQPLQFLVDGQSVTFTALGIGTSTIATVGHVAGIAEGGRVRYPDAFGSGIDYVIEADSDMLRKLITFRTPPPFTEDFQVDFSTSLQVESVIRGQSTQVGKIFFREPTIWDSGNYAQPITVRLAGGRLSKILPMTFFTRPNDVPDAPKLQYPVTTDVTTSYYAGVGDGYVYYSLPNEATWANAHNDTGTNATADYTSTTGMSGVNSDSGGYKTRRAFFPIDTSGIADNDTIDYATLNIYVTATANGGSCASAYNIVQTSQANYGHLVANDYDNCGSTHSPTYGATGILQSSLTTSAYNAWTLDSTGRGWIGKTASTTLGLRETTYDGADSTPSWTCTMTFSTSENTGTSQDPYLSVVTTPAAINSVTRVNADTGKEIFATSTEGIDITTNITGQTNGNTTIEYVFFMDLDADQTPDTNETYITNNCAGNAAWSSGAYTHQTTAFTIADGSSPKNDSWSCLDTSFGSEVGLYNIYVKWYDANGTIVATGTPSFQYCDQPTGNNSWWDTTMNNRAIIQFRSSTFSEALINFPVLVKATATNQILDDIESSGDDVRFLDEDTGTMLNFENEFVDATTTKEAYWWVQVPKVATSTDCDYISMYYDAATSTVATTTGVWRQDYYEAVWHFGETASSTAGTLYIMRDGEAGYTGTDDNYMDENASTYNYGSTTPILADESGTSTYDQHILTKFDVSSIPASCTVSNAYLTFYYTNVTANAYDIYEMLRSWVEGYKAGAAPDANGGATWANYDGTNAWATAGADGAADRNSASFGDLNDAAAINNFATTTLNATGKSIVEGWINGTNSNEGMWIGPGGGTETDGVAWVGNTGATTAQRPKFTVECGGVTAATYLDSTINNHDETNSTVASRLEKSQSKFGYSPKLSGAVGAGIGIPDSAGFDLANYTITGWFQREGNGDALNTGTGGLNLVPFTSKGYAEAESSAADIQWIVGVHSGGQTTLAADIEYETGSANDPVLGAKTLSNNTWYHFGMQVDGSNYMRLYLDGWQDNTTTNTLTDGPNTGGTMKAGIATGYNTSASADGGFQGYLDEIRIHKALLSADWLKAEWYTADNGYVEWGVEATTTGAAISISSAANQTFAVGAAATAISTITITDGSTPSITAANDIRIRIPSTFNMTFDATDTLANIAGSDWAKTGAASQGGTVTVSYEDSNKTVVVPVTTNFAAVDDITVYGLSFTSFTAISSADNLELEVDNGGTIAATDDKTITIVAPTLSSAANQSFLVSQAVTTSSPMTITDGTSAAITAANDIRIKIPAAFNMSWDSSKLMCTVAPTLADYSSFYSTNDLPTATIDVSGVTYSSTTDSLFMIINGTPTIHEYTLGGSLVRTVTMNGFIDTEGIDWMYGSTFAVTQERSPYDIITFLLNQSTTTLAKSEGTVITPTFTCTTNLCMEGIAYDVANDWFYVVSEKQADGSSGGRVFNVTMDGTATEYTALGTALSTAGYTDLADISYDPVTGNLFLLSQESNIIIEATTTGIVGTRAVDTGIFTQPEGLDFTPNGDSMFIVGEPDDYQRLTRDSKINNTVTYEDTNKTLVLDVTSNFSANETRTVGLCAFQNFTAASAADNLELEVLNDGGTNDYDDKTITITAASLSVTASSTLINFPAVSYNFSAQTTTSQDPAAGSVFVDGGGGTWTLNINCNANGEGCYWYGPGTRSYSFQDGVYPTAGYDGTEDLNIASVEATTNQDASAVNCVDYNGDGCVDVLSGIVRNLMQWDISSVSSDCTVSSASITVDNNITNGDSIHRFGVQALRRNWGETTATWNTYDGSNNWTTVGAADTSDDRYATDLMDGNSDGGWGRSALGVLTFDFDADGVAQLQDWINGTVTNNGIIFADNDTGDTNAFLWQNQVYATAASRPRLTIHCKKNSFRMRGGVVPADVPSTTGILCIADPFTCNATTGSCTNVTLTAVGCIGAASTKTMATGSGASGTYWLKEADWAQGIPGGTTTGIYTTTITWDLQ